MNKQPRLLWAKLHAKLNLARFIETPEKLETTTVHVLSMVQCAFKKYKMNNFIVDWMNRKMIVSLRRWIYDLNQEAWIKLRNIKQIILQKKILKNLVSMTTLVQRFFNSDLECSM